MARRYQHINNGQGPRSPRGAAQGRLLWLSVHMGLGLLWIGLLASRATENRGIGASGPQVFSMLLFAGWLPSLALACWQERHRGWRTLLASDLLAAGLLVLLAFTAYLPLFFVLVAWFLPLALLPRGLLTGLLTALLLWPLTRHQGGARPSQRPGNELE